MFLLSKLEDPNRPLLGINIKVLKVFGLLLPKNVYMKMFFICLHIITICYYITQSIETWFVKDDINKLSNNLKTAMLTNIVTFRCLTLLFMQNKWWGIIDYVTRTDIFNRTSDDPVKVKIVSESTNYTRKLSFGYYLIVIFNVVYFIYEPLYRYFSSRGKDKSEPLTFIISSWLPFDKCKMPGYWYAYVIQIFGTIFGGVWLAAYDCIVFSTLTFFKAELKILRLDSANLFGTESSTARGETVTERFKDLHIRHMDMMKYVRDLNSCLSMHMIMYMLICSLILCVSAFEITAQTKILQQLLKAQYLFLVIFQLFIYCWHCSDVNHTSLYLSLGPYESLWYNHSTIHRKNLYILTAQFSQAVVFTAGSFTTVTVATFISLMKGAYSFYTLLRKSEN
ncbi:hypothetical protein ACJJTC_007338 [Scirpophaga incertulas]